MIRLI